MPVQRAEQYSDGCKQQGQDGQKLQENYQRLWREETDELSREAQWHITGPNLKRVARSYKRNLCMYRRFPSRRDETSHKVVVFSHFVDVLGNWPATASCVMFFLLSKTVDSDRPMAPRVRADIMED